MRDVSIHRVEETNYHPSFLSLEIGLSTGSVNMFGFFWEKAFQLIFGREAGIYRKSSCDKGTPREDRP